MPKHIRIEKPPNFSSYRKYKPFLRKEFNYQCVYCNRNESSSENDSKRLFSVDHYLPKSSYPHFEKTYSNLFYSCMMCNSRKGVHDSKSLVNIFTKKIILNPCDHNIEEHLIKKENEWKHLSKEGEFTIKRLSLMIMIIR